MHTTTCRSSPIRVTGTRQTVRRSISMIVTIQITNCRKYKHHIKYVVLTHTNKIRVDMWLYLYVCILYFNIYCMCVGVWLNTLIFMWLTVSGDIKILLSFRNFLMPLPRVEPVAPNRPRLSGKPRYAFVDLNTYIYIYVCVCVSLLSVILFY